VPAGSEIVQLPATLLRLLGLAAPGLDGEPIEEILSDSSPGVPTTPTPAGAPERSPTSVYSEDEERRLIEHLRDLGYE
jgi:hypothetical protein